jgi:hypothetical protein
MKLAKSVFIVVLILLMSMMLVSAVQAADTAKPFGDVSIGVVQSLLGGLDWKAGVVRSIGTPELQGIVLKASRTIYTVKFDESKSLDLQGDLFAVEAEGGNHDALGLGFSLGTAKYIGFDLGVGYLSAGYGWSVTVTPWSMKL